MNFVKIIADDLTGALDSAAPFASTRRPVRLLARAGAGAGMLADSLAGVTASSESRELFGEAAGRAIEAAKRTIDAIAVPAGRAPVLFAKVDSVLRGRPVQETLHKHALWKTEICLFAPAFPKMGRRTVDGLHQIRVGDGWRAAELENIPAAFRQAGIEARLRRPGETVAFGAGAIIVGDARSEADLLDHVRAFSGAGSVLWAGSRGLAEALGTGNAPCPMPRISTLVNGTSHAATRAQLQALAQADDASRPRIIDPVPAAATAARTRDAVRAAVRALDPAVETGLLVIGGDTLACVLPAFGPQAALDCIGEVSPGVPLSRVTGGPFDGLPLVTKSGGFGATALLRALLRPGG